MEWGYARVGVESGMWEIDNKATKPNDVAAVGESNCCGGERSVYVGGRCCLHVCSQEIHHEVPSTIPAAIHLHMGRGLSCLERGRRTQGSSHMDTSVEIRLDCYSRERTTTFASNRITVG